MGLPTMDERREAELAKKYPQEYERFRREAKSESTSFAQWLMRNPPRSTMERAAPPRSLGRDGTR